RITRNIDCRRVRTFFHEDHLLIYVGQVNRAASTANSNIVGVAKFYMIDGAQKAKCKAGISDGREKSGPAQRDTECARRYHRRNADRLLAIGRGIAVVCLRPCDISPGTLDESFHQL